MMRSFRRGLEAIDPASFSVFRVCMGLLLAVEAVRYLANGWVAAHLTEPRFHFTYPGLAWVQPVQEPYMTGVVWLLGLGGLALAFGRARRWVALGLMVGWAYLASLDRALYLNHHYLVVVLCFWMVCIPAVVPRWGVWALRAQLLLVYTWAGISKLDGDWFAGMPLHLSLGPFVGERWISTGLSWAVIASEVAAIPLFLWPRTRPWIAMFFVLFHLATIPLYSIGIFPYLSLALLTLWAPADWPRRSVAGPWKPLTSSRPRVVAAYIGAAFLAFQTVYPARTFLAEGHPSWTMTHSRGTWRLLTAHKSGWVRFELTTRDEGEFIEVSPLDYLTFWQASKMARNPWMIRDFAHWLADEQVRHGLSPVEVRARTGVSLNGRPPVSSVQPHVDLVNVGDDTALFSWVAPLSEPLPDEPVLLDGSWWLLQMRGYSSLIRDVEAAVRNGRWDALEEPFRDALLLDPERDDVPAAVVVAMIDEGRSDEALVCVEAWLQAAPNRSAAFLLRGRIHYEKGRLALAKPALQQAVALGGGAGPRLALARIAADQGQADEARRWLEEACRHAPADPQPALMLAELLTRHYGATDEALAVLDRMAPSAQVNAARDAVLRAQSAQGSTP